MPLHRLTVACAALAAVGAAHAGRPLATEDAGVLEARTCELESYVGRQRERDAPSARAFSAQFGCGIGWRSQAALSVARERSDGDRQQALSLVGKTALSAPANASSSAYALAWEVGAVKNDGDGWRRESAALTAVASAPLANALTLHSNLGWSHSRAARQSSTGWALAVEHAGAAGVDLMAELFADDRDQDPWLQFGVRWALVPERVWLDGSWGRQAAPGRPRAVTLGLKIAL